MSDVRRPAVSFIGLGAMGRPMAARLGKAGDCELTVFDVSPTALERASGIGRRAETVEEAIRTAEIVMTMLPADAHVSEVVEHVRRYGRAGQVLIDFSTIHPDTIETAAARLPDSTILSASCMKSVAAAVSGDLTIYLGGDRAALSELDPLLAAMATTRIEVGSRSGAKALKLVNNMIVAGTNLAIAELAVIGASHGVSYPSLVSAFEAEGAGGWALVNHVKKHTLADDLGPGYFSVDYMAKDIMLAAALCESVSAPSFLCGPVLAALRGAAAHGHGAEYHPVAIRWVETVANVSPPGADTVGIDASPRVLADLVAAMGAFDQLIARHGLGVAAAFGIPHGGAAVALGRASAASTTMARLASDRPTGQSLGGAQLISGLDRARDLAIATRVPAVAVECAREFARSGAVS